MNPRHTDYDAAVYFGKPRLYSTQTVKPGSKDQRVSPLLSNLTNSTLRHLRAQMARPEATSLCLRCLPAGSAPAMIAAADPVSSGWATPPTVASCFLNRGRGLRLRLDARSTGHLSLRVRQRHRSGHEYGGRQSHDNFSHATSS